ncbi:MAG: hypothetical protein ACRC0V_00155 [Fusobacteriaceae bacterium]
MEVTGSKPKKTQLLTTISFRNQKEIADIETVKDILGTDNVSATIRKLVREFLKERE